MNGKDSARFKVVFCGWSYVDYPTVEATDMDFWQCLFYKGEITYYSNTTVCNFPFICAMMHISCATQV